MILIVRPNCVVIFVVRFEKNYRCEGVNLRKLHRGEVGPVSCALLMIHDTHKTQFSSGEIFSSFEHLTTRITTQFALTINIAPTQFDLTIHIIAAPWSKACNLAWSQETGSVAHLSSQLVSQNLFINEF